jgi:hypothetical protein
VSVPGLADGRDCDADSMQRNLSLALVWPDDQRFFFDVIIASKDE